MQRYILNEQTGKFYDFDIHHIKNVMKMKNDDKVIVCLKEKCFIAKLIIDKEVSFKIETKIEVPKTLNITLIQGMLKGSKIDDTIKYATIFGAKKIIISKFNYSIAKIDNTIKKKNRYEKIAKEAAELAHRNMIPDIVIIKNIFEIDFDNYDYIIVADELETSKKLSDLKIDYKLDPKIAVIVGPEGGISMEERIFFKNKKFDKITLGKFILPAEIAAISVLNSFLMTILDN